MSWKGVTVREQKQRFLENYVSYYCSITDLAERFGISEERSISGSIVISSMARPGTRSYLAAPIPVPGKLIKRLPTSW